MTGIKDFEVSNYDEINEKLTEHEWQIDLQLLDAQKILVSHHIYFATLSALNAFKRKKNISKNLALEILLYVSGQKQIRVAIDVFGLRKGRMDVVLVAIGDKKGDLKRLLENICETFDIEIDDSFIDSFSERKSKDIRSTFEISSLEIDAVKRKGVTLKKILRKLIMERMAFLYAGIR